MGLVWWWIAAVVISAAPRRIWPRLDSRLPLRSAAFPAGLLTLTLGFVIGVRGFFQFAGRLAGANNDWMLHQFTLPPAGHDVATGMVPYGLSILTPLLFLFTPTGLVALYLTGTGSVRAIAVYINPEDARGDFILSGVHWATSTLIAKRKAERARRTREAREGPEAPDLLFTGEWAGVTANYVLVASRRKPEWKPGAIILTSTEWYRLGVSFDLDMPGGVRTAYPLTKLDAVEVVRRGIRYELPRLVPARNSARTRS